MSVLFTFQMMMRLRELKVETPRPPGMYPVYQETSTVQDKWGIQIILLICTHNICFHGEIRIFIKKFGWKKAPCLELCYISIITEILKRAS